MDNLISLISEIRDIIRKSEINLELNLPIIAVVGSQSTGKSTLLQSIIGKQFLPKGRGIVTRRPIQIQLIHIQQNKQYAEFGDKKGEKTTDFELIKKLIDIDTQKICGNTKGVSPIPIKLKIYSKNVLDLLLVDLPGITKNPIGQQPKDIQEQILKMVKPYIKNQHCIIMAVSKATDDLANSQSLKLAREIDPQGKRTIGVVTQMDLVQQNQDLIKDFTSLKNPLRLGYVGLYLRSNKLSLNIQQQYQKQKQFFENHPVYSKYANKMGVKYLLKTLNENFINHIAKNLPIIKQNIVTALQIKKHQYKQYGQFQTLVDKKAQGMLILILISKYVKYFLEVIQGKSIDSHYQIVGGARIHYIFESIFNKSITNMDPFQYLSDQDLRTAIKNANGLSKSLFVPQIAFENLIRQQISRLQLPSLQCSHLIHQQIKRLLNYVSIPQIQRFKNLSAKISTVMEDLLKQCLSKTQTMINNLIQIETGYINRNHPDFIDIITNLQNPQKNIEEKKQEKEKLKQKQKQKIEKQKNFTTTGFAFSKKNRPNEILEPYQMKQRFRQNLDRSDILQKSQYSQNLKKDRHYNILQLNQLYNVNKTPHYFPRYSLPGVPQIIKVSQQPKHREQTQTDMIKKLIVSYFNVVKKNINDSIPKTIITFLINQFKNTCEKVLVNNLYKEEQFEQLLFENEQVMNARNEIKKSILVLRQCLNQISKFNIRYV